MRISKIQNQAMLSDRFSLTNCVFDWSLFLGSYSPLFVIAALRWGEHREVILPLLAAALVALGPQSLILYFTQRQQARPYIVKDVELKADANAGYLSGYLLPFITVDAPSSWSVWAAYGLFIWLVGLISTRGRLLYVNPTLYLLRFDVARIQTTEGGYNLIARRIPEPGDTISATRLLRGNLLLET